MGDSTAWELQETIQGVTFTYRSRGGDPIVPTAAGRRNDVGDFEDMLLSAGGDDPAMPVVDARPITFDVISILTYEGKGRFWRYTVNTTNQTWTRDDGSGASPARPVSDLRIKIDRAGETEHAPSEIEVAGTRGEYVSIIHPGSTCRMVWNYATRRYTRVCS
ncbi:MAG TPA: hypothetical protein VHO73_07395 [Methylomirabilota bacterium]|jgi:hypothetical protein|nr:hypothetical protein [Methylomirabilota bacterium]